MHENLAFTAPYNGDLVRVLIICSRQGREATPEGEEIRYSSLLTFTMSRCFFDSQQTRLKRVQVWDLCTQCIHKGD